LAPQEVPADVVVRADGELGEPAERGVVVAFGIGEADAHRRRLTGGRVVDADVDGVKRPAHWYCAPTLSRMPLYAAAAFGNSSGPVAPPVGPPPFKCGSSVAKPS